MAVVSLNRFEQRVFDYWEGHPEERQFWREKVRGAAKIEPDGHALTSRLDGELWRYFVERSGVVPSFLEAAGQGDLQRTSMKALAELTLRLWVEPKPKKAPASEVA